MPQDQNQLRRVIRAEQIALELNGRLLGAHCAYLLGDGASFRDTRAASLARLREISANAIPARAFESVASWKRYLGMQH